MTPMTPEEFAAKMREIFPETGYAKEESHVEADRLLCQVLRSLGYGDGVAAFEDADKWYA